MFSVNTTLRQGLDKFKNSNVAPPQRASGSVIADTAINIVVAVTALPAIGLLLMKSFSLSSYGTIWLMSMCLCAVAVLVFPVARKLSGESRKNFRICAFSFLFAIIIGATTLGVGNSMVIEKYEAEASAIESELYEAASTGKISGDMTNVPAEYQGKVDRYKELVAAMEKGSPSGGQIALVLGVDFFACMFLLSFGSVLSKTVSDELNRMEKEQKEQEAASAATAIVSADDESEPKT